MAESGRVLGNRVYCHSCEHEWDRSHGGLQCPQCSSEFVEVIEPPATSNEPSNPSLDPAPPFFSHPSHVAGLRSPPPLPNHPFHNHNPWASVPDEDDITTFEFNNGRTRTTVSSFTRTYTFGGNQRARGPAADETMRDFESMLEGMLGRGRDPRGPALAMGGGFFHFGGPQDSRGSTTQSPHNAFLDLSNLFPTIIAQRQPGGVFTPGDLLNQLFNGQHGDAVYSDEGLNRVLTQLMDQTQSDGPPPASDAAISSLKKKTIDKTMLGSDGKAECSICMDNVEIGDDVTNLPCNHWFHEDCVVSWLKEHDTCPHCRKPITQAEDTEQPPAQGSSRRRIRRASSIASPLASPHEEESSRYGHQVMDSPSGLRNGRERYYSNSRSDEIARPESERRSSARSDRDPDNAQGGVGGWLRSRMGL